MPSVFCHVPPSAAHPARASPRGVQVVTWFLLSLLIWRTVLPVIVTLRAPISTTFVVAHLALFVDLGLNYQNLLSFMPCAALRGNSPSAHPSITLLRAPSATQWHLMSDRACFKLRGRWFLSHPCATVTLSAAISCRRCCGI